LRNTALLIRWHALSGFAILDQDSMGVLFAVFVLCLVALIWTIIALKRHIRNHDVRGSEPLRLESNKNEDPLRNLD